MVKQLLKISFVTGMLFMASCATGPQPRPGAIYTGLQGPNQAMAGKEGGKKTGESCASSVLGLVGWGDASVDSARVNGDIQNIGAVDYKSFSVLGFVYAQTCTLVSGS
ncbi:MAG: TRL-like family protein [Proteobacteria bacterium]|nr:TRL-like family protein [Pseudomonadota bacterium]